jgi:drug/metabolite transporter (DMT)-like permease
VLERGVHAMSAASLAAASVAGLSVAAYSVLDAYGVRINGDWLGFTVWLVAADSALFVGYALGTRRARALRQWRDAWRLTLVSGLLGVASYGVFMWALGRALAALRETSIVFAAIVGTLVLKERMGRVRALSVLLVAAGVAAIALIR